MAKRAAHSVGSKKKKMLRRLDDLVNGSSHESEHDSGEAICNALAVERES